MPLRTSVRVACRRCRKKRAKCDGQAPCSRCEEASEPCEYDVVQRESKGELRAETARLRKSNVEGDVVLRAVASIPDPHMCKIALQGLVDGSLSRDDILREYRDRASDSSGPSSHTSQTQSPFSQQSTVQGFRQDDPATCFEQLLTWRSCRPNPRTVDAPTPPPLSLPPLPLDAYTAHSRQVDNWTRTGWTRAHVRHLIDALRTWDYLPFCLFCEDLFLRDYDSDSTRFCSFALVHAILALSTRLINESSDDAALLPSGWLSSQVFFDRAKAHLPDDSQLAELPDIQALGILALYRLRCGLEAEAGELAEVFAARVTEFCQRSPPEDEAREDCTKARVITYCGAVSLIRMLSLVTGRLFNAPDPVISEDLFSLDQLAGGTRIAGQCRDGLRPNLSTTQSEPWNAQLIAANLFQLTEWVYNVILSAEADIHAASRDITSVYERCLRWYKEFFGVLAPDGGRTPFVLFVHMYYHFCLLSAFRPFVSLTLENAEVKPQEICTQAVHSILALAQSYDDLFTLRRVSGLIPYFVCASGLFSLAMEDGGSQVGPLRLRRGDGEAVMTEADLKEGELAGLQMLGHPRTPVQTSHVKISPAAHARSLLAKIGSTHLAAMTADKLLREQIASRFRQKQQQEDEEMAG
ncbi:hypothetical protein B0T16DRAFT_235932 [Cercophora newfieldiana]|uniref:Zn(2)-C6 fungal-type domain-containing protein n=1 Tax=Cercophora newfieldiana TaxID=92897 RepID=A0AA39XRS2_9PEZI|nr:hypothetical protein B0T16DRAFT_235932 [Cercophora newfieldiana]